MKAVIFGAGNIGRGFIGQLLSESGYEVVFIDVLQSVVKALNEMRSYPVRVVSNAGHTETVVYNVRAVNGLDLEAVAKEIESADILATAVGAHALPKTAPALALGLQKRFEQEKPPINILLCENLMHANTLYKSWVSEQMKPEYAARLETDAGFIECSVGRMVPVMTEAMQEGDLLRIWVEPYCELPLDGAALLKPLPVIKNAVPFSPFEFYIQRKLFIHNLGHAACAYLGHLKGYEYIWQAVEDKEILKAARAAMEQSAASLSKRYGVPRDKLKEHIEDLLHRFGNRALGDTVARVGKDPLRKLAPNDRITGALTLCREEGLPYGAIETILKAALRFKREDDPASLKMAEMIREKGEAQFLKEWCQI